MHKGLGGGLATAMAIPGWDSHGHGYVRICQGGKGDLAVAMAMSRGVCKEPSHERGYAKGSGVEATSSKTIFS